MQKIVIVSQQRQGSTMVHTLLKSHTMVQGEGELFKQRTLHETFPKWALKWVDRFPFWYLRFKELHCRAPYFVFKFMVNQVSNPRSFIKKMNQHGYKIISIHREDAIGIALSRCIAEQTKVWYVRSPEIQLKDKIHIDPQKLINSIAEVDRYYKIQKRALEGIDYLPIHYENDLCRNDNFEYFSKIVCDFTGLPFKRLFTHSLPTDERSDEERIINYEEIMQAIKSSEWTKYLSQYHCHKIYSH